MKAYEFHNNLCISWRMKIAPMPAFNLHRWYKVYQIAELITVL